MSDHNEKESDDSSRSVLHNWLNKLSDSDREKFLRTVGDHELMTLASSEDEFRMITGRDIPDNFAAFKPVSADDKDASETTEQMLDERLEEILEAFPRSSDDLRQMGKESEDEPIGKPKHSLDDLKKMSQPSLKIQVTVEQMREIANKS